LVVQGFYSDKVYNLLLHSELSYDKVDCLISKWWIK